MKFKTGENYEKLVQVVFQSILNQGDVRNVVVQRDVILQGKHSSHQVDIYWRFALDHLEYETIVEAKDWKDAIEQGELFKFKSVLEDLPGQPKGIFVSRNGYQKGAREFAFAHGILLYELREGDFPSLPNLIVGGWGQLEVVRMPLRGVIGTTDETLAKDWCVLGFKADIYNPVYSRIDLNASRAWMEGEYGASNLGTATKIDFPPTPANEVHLYDEHGALVGNLWSVCQTMGKDIAATAADGERTHAFEKPTFILTGSSVFPRIKITSVSVEVRIDHTQETVRCRASNFAQWVLCDIKSGKSHWFAATPSAQALLGNKTRGPSLGQDLLGFTSSGPGP